jgi:hypothetical protein
MTREQYEDQKRRLAEQHRSLMALLESAHQTQLQALDMVWRMLSGEGASPQVPAVSRPKVAAPSSARGRRRAHELEEEVAKVLSRLPETFTSSDVCRLLGYTPDRASLYRVLQRLKLEGQLVVDFPGSGTSPAIYRKIDAEQRSSGT